MAFYIVGILLGLFMVAAAVFNWETFFVGRDSRFVELIGGESLLRWYWGIGGLILILVTLIYMCRTYVAG